MNFLSLDPDFLSLDLMKSPYIGPVWVNNLFKHLFYKSLLDESLCHKYFIQ